MISVIVSIYNAEKYLNKCIESILCQKCRDFELILVDDGSPDRCPQICDEWAEKDERIRVFHKPNGGLSSARNCGLAHAKGDYVIFPDPDDWVEADYLSHLLELINTYEADLSICGRFRDNTVMDKDKSLTVMDMKTALEQLMYPSSFCGFAWNKLFKKDIITKNNLSFDEELGMIQDLHFCVRYVQCCKRIVYDPLPLYRYSVDLGGVTSRHTALTPRKISGILAYKKIAEIAHDSYPRVEEIAYCSLCNLCLGFIMIYYEQKMKSKETLKLLKSYFVKYKKYYYNCDVYSAEQKKCSRLAAVHPYIYYTAMRIYWHRNG